MRLLDANVFLRYMLQDNMEQALAAKAVFDRLAQNEETAFVAEAVVAEVVFVLTSRRLYNLPRQEAAGKTTALLTPQALRLRDKPIILRGLRLFADHAFLDFPDALQIAYMEPEADSLIYSFDQGFDRVDGVTRVEPVAT